MSCDLKTKNALLKIFELILSSDINKLLTIKTGTLVKKLTQKYLENTNIINSNFSNNFNLEALDFETQIMINNLNNLLKKENHNINFDEVIRIHENTDTIKLWLCLAVILQVNKNEFILFENGHECAISGEIILKIMDNPSNFHLTYNPMSESEFSYIKQLGELFNCEIYENCAIDYNKITSAMQQWLLSLPKYAWVVNQKYQGYNKYESISKEYLKFRDMLKIYPISPIQTIRYKIPKIFNTDFFLLIMEIENVKSYFEYLIFSLENRILEDLDYIFDGNFEEWVIYKTTASKDKFMHENSEEEIFSLISISKNERFVKLCEFCLNIEPNNFEDSTPSKLFDKLISIKKTIDKHKNISNLIHFRGKDFKFCFEKSKNNQYVKILSNEINSILNEYGKNLSANEKRTALLEIMQNFNKVVAL